MLVIRLSADIEKRLERLAKRTGRTKTYYAREAIMERIGDLENIYLAGQEYAEKIKAEVKSSPRRNIKKPLRSRKS